MRILLVAYDYPPLNSPQAIRWYYLSRELARLGVEMHVLAPDLVARDGNGLLPPPGVIIHRCDAGGLAGWLARRYRSRRSMTASGTSRQPLIDGTQVGSVALNWKGRLHQRLERGIGHWVYPDSRGQWRTSASVALEKLIDAIQPDVLITSHEPAVTLQLGMQMAKHVPAWLADLGDPVLADYTPKRWYRRASKLEADVCRMATAISVTTVGTRELLLARHRLDPSKIFVLSQGFEDTALPVKASAGCRNRGELHLFYSGRFYSFRDPTALLEAVLSLKQVRLTIASPEVKAEYLVYAERSEGRIIFLGEQPHAKVLELQKGCDVLVNIGNAQNAQTPGKLYEYLGSGKPILHCHYADDDPVNTLLIDWQRGWSCRNDCTDLQAFIAKLAQSPRLLKEAAIGDAAVVADYGWSRLGQSLFDRCMTLQGGIPS